MSLHVLSCIAKSLCMLSIILFPLNAIAYYETDQTYGVCDATCSVKEEEYTNTVQVFPNQPNFGTQQSASGIVWADMFNDMGDRNDGWYDITVDLNGVVSEKTEYYTSGVYESHSDTDYFSGKRPSEVSGYGTSYSYLYGVGCSDSDYLTKNFEDRANNDKLGISPTDRDQRPVPGDTFYFKVACDSQFYWIDVWVKAPWDTSEKGTKLGNGVLGDGVSTEHTFSYTFPSGVMNTGDFLITATIYRYSDMSDYTQTYTVTVSSPS